MDAPIAPVDLRVHVTDAADPELCALPAGVHSYHIGLPPAMRALLDSIPVGSFLWDGEKLVLTASALNQIEG